MERTPCQGGREREDLDLDPNSFSLCFFHLVPGTSFTLSHDDETYVIAKGQPFIKVNLTEFTVSPVTGVTFDCGDYPPGKTLLVAPGVCDISCSATDNCGNTATGTYLITVKVEDVCEDLGSLTNAIFTKQDEYTNGDVIALSCGNTEELDGGDSVSCTSDPTGNANWPSNIPQCVPKQCASSYDSSVATITVQGTNLGDTASYACNPEFSGEGVLNCALDGQNNAVWEGDLNCAAKQCASSYDSAVATVTVQGTDLGDTANYACNPEFSGEGVLNCALDDQNNAVWEGDINCAAKQCASSYDSAVATVTVQGTDLGDTANYACNDGYTGEGVLNCALDGQNNAVWEGDIDCAEVGQTEVVLECGRGFDLVGDKCYRVINEEDIWELQCAACRDLDANLVVPGSPEEQALLERYIADKVSSGKEVWIGINSLAKQDDFRSVTYGDLGYLGWRSGKPNTRNSRDFCEGACVAQENGKSGWDNDCCFQEKAAVCEREPSNKPAGPCPAGFTLWQDQYCFRYYGSERTFEEQCAECKASAPGASLATAENQGKNDALYAFLHEYMGFREDIYFNCQDMVREGAWESTDRSLTYTWTNWETRKGQPNGKGHENCARLRSGGWWDICCFNEYPAVCEAPIDGGHFLGQAEPDTPGPRAPPPPKECPSPFRLQGDQCFYFNPTRDTWEEHCKACKKHGGALAAVNSYSRNQNAFRFLYNNHAHNNNLEGNSNSFGVWVNLNDQRQEGRWATIDGQEYNSFTNWNAECKEPNGGGHSNCGRLRTYQGQQNWFDMCCHKEYPALCEFLE